MRREASKRRRAELACVRGRTEGGGEGMEGVGTAVEKNDKSEVGKSIEVLAPQL